MTRNSTSASSSSTTACPVIIPIVVGNDTFTSDTENQQTNSYDNSGSATNKESKQSFVAEWTMIELNGELVAPQVPLSVNESQEIEIALGGPNRVELGLIQFIDQDPKKPILILGSHELKGTVQVLKEPFCVMEKRHGRPSPSDPLDENQMQLLGAQISDTYYKIVGVVRQKFLFNSYPKVIMR